MIKNFRIYQLRTIFPDDLHDKLAGNAFHPCGSIEHVSMGWVPPLGKHGTNLTHGANGRTLICVRREERILPPDVIREHVAEKAAEIEKQEGRTLSRREHSSIKDDIILELLPKSFTRSHRSYIIIDPLSSLLIVEATSAPRAEEALAMLRQSLDGLRVSPISPMVDPSAAMTRWASDDVLPGSLKLGDECVLKDPGDEGGSARTKNIDMNSEEIEAHLNAGKRIIQMAIGFDDRLTCVLKDDLSIHRFNFTNVLEEELAEVETDDEIARFDAEFSLFTLELGRFLPQMLEWFGGPTEIEG